MNLSWTEILTTTKQNTTKLFAYFMGQNKLFLWSKSSFCCIQVQWNLVRKMWYVFHGFLHRNEVFIQRFTTVILPADFLDNWPLTMYIYSYDWIYTMVIGYSLPCLQRSWVGTHRLSRGIACMRVVDRYRAVSVISAAISGHTGLAITHKVNMVKLWTFWSCCANWNIFYYWAMEIWWFLHKVIDLW